MPWSRSPSESRRAEPGLIPGREAAGAIVVYEPYGFEESAGSLVATLADPDDNYFQLMSPMGPSDDRWRWPGLLGSAR